MARTLLFQLVLCLVTVTLITAKYGDKLTQTKGKEFLRKTIVFDKMTPDVFYCPMEKPSAMNKLIVRYYFKRSRQGVLLILILPYPFLYSSRPLHKLCEYEGRPLPEDYKPDCYDNIDESNYACKEKYRIMVSSQLFTL